MKTITYIVVLCFLFLFAGSCQQPVAEPEAVRIGLIAYTEDEHLTGVGIPTINAARMAVEEINATGGVQINNRRVPVELILEGIASSPQNAVATVRKLTNRDNVSAIVGLQYSVDAIPAGVFADKARIPFISPMSTNSLTTLGREYVFRMSFIDEQQGSVMARFAYHDLGSRRAAVLFDRTDPYSSGIAEVFKKTYHDLGASVVSYQPFLHSSVDYESIFNQIKAASPDVLYLPGFAVDVLKQARLAREQGVTVRFLGADGWNAYEFSRNPVFKDSYMTTHWFNVELFSKAAVFSENYFKNFKVKPDAVAALTYDAMHLIFAALERTGAVDGESLRDAIVDMDAFEGVTGEVDFIDSGDPDKGVLLLKFEDDSVVVEKVVARGGI